MQNVLFAVNYSSPSEGSFMRSLTALGEELGRNGQQAVYLLPEESKKYEWTSKLIANGCSVYFFSNSFFGLFKTQRIIKKIIKLFNIGIIHSFFADSRLQLAISFAAAGNKELEYIAQLNQPLDSNPSFKEKLALLLHDVTLYIAESETIKNSVTIEGKRSKTILNAVDFARLEAVDGEIKREDFIKSDNQKIIFVFGQQINAKGIDFIINTLKEYDTEHHFILLIATKDIDAAEKDISEISGGIPEYIKLLPETNNIATYFNISDIYILPKNTQGSPYTMIECAYLGLPIIYCDDENKNELNIPWSVNIGYGDGKALYDAVCGIINEDKNEAAQMSKEAKEYVVNNFSLGSWVYEIINTYKNIDKI